MRITPPQLESEFHVSRVARETYHFDDTLFSLHGAVIFANFRAARRFAQAMNAKRDLISFPERTVRAGQINAMGLIDEIFHYVVTRYRETMAPTVMAKALAWVEEKVGTEDVAAALRRFADTFPTTALYRREIDLDTYLAGSTDGIPHRQLVLEELMILWVTNMNPACAPYLELFDDAELEKETAYPAIIAGLRDFFATQPPFGPDHQPLLDMLRAPAIAVPHSFAGQLDYILARWGFLLGSYLYRLLSSLDLIREEEKAIFLGPGPTLVYDYTGMEGEPERFSQDKDWMPRAVMMAKNAYVWLDQLSKTYQRAITRLDQIPDEELDRLARWGFTALWLIGLWERSPASQRIKQLCGNPEAVASAYSLYAYDPANDLGGEEALANLRARAWQRGIRLASDMVPNHMGIDSPWVIEHPDWFIGLDYSPFPSYSFSGPNLSRDGRVGLFIDDHYYARTDAAVVFKRVDFHTGSEKYIYHGNDGTSMPWNDTAQLNYLHPAVREAVIQTILHVARHFPIIRFDAAMTLAKRHYQRLWYPEPGTGGAIPSRAEHGMTREAFHAAFPVEFWREVVDRVAQEVPDTLLLAEAFWLMEGYFVRTLGMHRVYNSAFMNLLRDEDNGKYRAVMRNTMEFDLEIMKRFVNFMNNPDERTAIDQFGTGDKYFGICTLMATLPGLPMFGHGQVEGFSEKYGMEYRRAYWDEWVNDDLVRRHEHEIFPLLHRRYIFAEATHFLLYDFVAPEGYVVEDVFAFSNRAGHERGLVIYHNKFASTRGWIHDSVGFAVKTGAEGEKTIIRRTLGEGLGLHPDGNCYTIFRDQVTGLEYIRNSKELCERGLFVELHAYQRHVFLDFREVPDNEWHHYADLCAYLHGHGVPSIDAALREIFLRPVHHALQELLNAGMLQWLHANRGADVPSAVLDEYEGKMRRLLEDIRSFSHAEGDPAPLARQAREELHAVLTLSAAKGAAGELASDMLTALDDDPVRWATVFGWLILHDLGAVAAPDEAALQSRSWLDEWLFGRLLGDALADLGAGANDLQRALTAVQVLTTHQHWFRRGDGRLRSAYEVLQAVLADGEVQRALQINRYQGVLWFNREAFELALRWLALTAAVAWRAAAASSPEEREAGLRACAALIADLRAAADGSDYQVQRLLDGASRVAPAGTGAPVWK